MQTTSAEYRRYLKSPYWQRVRGLLIWQRGGKCEKCGGTQTLQAHHLHYRFLYVEQSHMECLQLLCKACHEKETRKKRKPRRFFGLR